MQGTLQGLAQPRCVAFLRSHGASKLYFAAIFRYFQRFQQVFEPGGRFLSSGRMRLSMSKHGAPLETARPRLDVMSMPPELNMKLATLILSVTELFY